MVLVLSLPDLDPSSLSPDSPSQSPTVPETPSPTSLAFSPSSNLPGSGSPTKVTSSRNDIFSRTFTPTPSPLSPPTLADALPDKPGRLSGASLRGVASQGRERSSTEPPLLPSALSLESLPRRRIETLDVLPVRSDSLKPTPPPPPMPLTPRLEEPPASPTAYDSPSYVPHHAKSPSGASARSVSSTKTSSFFDSPRAVTTPPPPPRQPTLVVRPTLPPRTSSYQSGMPLPRSAVSNDSLPSPSSSPSSPPLELLELTALLSDMVPPPPIAALRLSTAPTYHLGTGLTSSVYLASTKGTDRAGWSLCAAKILSEESGAEGQQALAREEKVLRWLGAGRIQAHQGIVSYIGAVGVVQAAPVNGDPGQVRARRRRTTSISTGLPYETFTTGAATLVNDVLGVATLADPSSILLLEYCPFGTLGDFVKTHPELVDEALFVRWVGDLARGGEWLQARGVVHRDIKPQNVLLSSTLTPRLTDFGNSLVLAPTSPLAAVEGVTSGAGTLPYSSPELLQTPSKVSYPADLFSLGCTLYVVLNGGRDPFRGVSGTREMVFWVSGAKFWEFEERARAASFGEGAGSVGFRRGRSLREPGKGADKAAAALEADEPTALAAGGSTSPMRKPGSWECLRVDKRSGVDGGSEAALDTSQRAWWKSRRSTADEGIRAGQRATRRSLEFCLTAEDGPTPNGRPPSPPQDHLLHLLSTSPTFAPLSLPTLHPPAQILGGPPTPPFDDSDDEPLPGPPMFFPASTPYQPLQAPESLRRLIRRMLHARPETRGSMRDVRRWAATHGWRAQDSAPKDE